MSATRLLVLGVVRMRGEAHGYQVRQDLAMWAADRWANVKPGSIYHALKKLAADGALEAVHTEESPQGPDRVVYRITRQGEGDFFYQLNSAISDVNTGQTMFNAALPFFTTLDRATLLFLLRSRIRQVEGQIATSEFLNESTMIAENPDEIGKPAHVREMFRYWSASLVGVLDWLRDLVARLEAGEYVLADDSPTAFGMPPPTDERGPPSELSPERRRYGPRPPRTLGLNHRSETRDDSRAWVRCGVFFRSTWAQPNHACQVDPPTASPNDGGPTDLLDECGCLRQVDRENTRARRALPFWEICPPARQSFVFKPLAPP
ncbi:hypothetical protein GCM10029964_006230 [Kibdelosporangium lantanae]